MGGIWRMEKKKGVEVENIALLFTSNLCNQVKVSVKVLGVQYLFYSLKIVHVDIEMAWSSPWNILLAQEGDSIKFHFALFSIPRPNSPNASPPSQNSRLRFIHISINNQRSNNDSKTKSTEQGRCAFAAESLMATTVVVAAAVAVPIYCQRIKARDLTRWFVV